MSEFTKLIQECDDIITETKVVLQEAEGVNAEQTAAAAAEKAREGARKLKLLLARGTGATAGLVVIGLIGTLAYLRFFSRHARVCRGKSLFTRHLCVLNAKRSAKLEEIKELRRRLPQCKRSKDSGKCEAGVNNRIAKAERKAREFEDRIKERAGHIRSYGKAGEMQR